MPFNPKYTITDKTLNNLTSIAAAREIIEQSYLVPKWEAKLRQEALLRSAHASTAITGNRLSFEEVKALWYSRQIQRKRKAHKRARLFGIKNAV